MHFLRTLKSHFGKKRVRSITHFDIEKFKSDRLLSPITRLDRIPCLAVTFRLFRCFSSLQLVVRTFETERYFKLHSHSALRASTGFTRVILRAGK